MTIITPPPNLLRGLGLRKGRVAIINQGVGVGPGSAACRTSRRKSIKIGAFPAGQYYYPKRPKTSYGTPRPYFGLLNIQGLKFKVFILMSYFCRIMLESTWIFRPFGGRFGSR